MDEGPYGTSGLCPNTESPIAEGNTAIQEYRNDPRNASSREEVFFWMFASVAAPAAVIIGPSIVTGAIIKNGVAYLAPKVAHGLIGSGASATGNAIAQAATNEGSLSERITGVDSGDVKIAAGVGFLSGGASTFVSTGGGAAAAGASANTAQYALTQASNGEKISATALLVSAVTGGIVGKIIGPAPSSGEQLQFDTSGLWMDARRAMRLNAKADIGRITKKDFLRSIIGSVFTNLESW